jgi:hypothetical protein
MIYASNDWGSIFNDFVVTLVTWIRLQDWMQIPNNFNLFVSAVGYSSLYHFCLIIKTSWDISKQRNFNEMQIIQKQTLKPFTFCLLLVPCLSLFRHRWLHFEAPCCDALSSLVLSKFRRYLKGYSGLCLVVCGWSIAFRWAWSFAQQNALLLFSR